MKKYSVYLSCTVDAVLTIKATSEEEAQQIADLERESIEVAETPDFLPEQFSKTEAHYCPDQLNEFVMICQDLAKYEPSCQFADGRLYEVFVNFEVEFAADVTADNLEELDDLLFHNTANFFDCTISPKSSRVESTYVALCEDYQIFEAKENKSSLCVA